MPISAGDAVWTIKANLDKLKAKMAEAKSMVGRTMQGFVAHSKQIAIGMGFIGGGIVAALGSAVKSSMKFKEGLAEIRTLGVKDLETIKKGIEDVSTTFGKDLTDATKAAYNVISFTSKDGAEAVGILNQAAKAATAGVTDINSAVTIGSRILNAFGKDSSELNEIYGEIFIAVKNGATTFGELADSAGRVAPAFKGSGLASEQLFAALAAITGGSLQTSEAVTGLKAVITALQKPGEDAKRIAEALHMEFDTVAAKSKGLIGFLIDLRKTVEEGNPALLAKREHLRKEIARLEDLTERSKDYKAKLKALNEERTAAGLKMIKYNDALRVQKEALKEAKEGLRALEKVGADASSTMASLFGSSEAVNTVLALTAEDGKKASDTLDDMANKATAVDEAFEAFEEDNPALTFKKLREEVNKLRREIGDGLAPSLDNAIQNSIDPAVKALNKFAEENEALVGDITLTIGSLGALGVVLFPVVFSIKAIIAVVKGLGVSFKWLYGVSIRKLIASLVGRAGVAGSATKAGAALAAIGGWPVAAFGAAVLAMLGSIWYFREQITYAYDRTYRFIRDATVGTWNYVKRVTSDNVAYIAELFGILEDKARHVMDTLYSLAELMATIAFDVATMNFAAAISKIDTAIAEGKVGAAGGMVPAFASGGGLAPVVKVGEQGPEYVRLPVGSQVFSAPDSRRMDERGSVSVNIDIRDVHIASELDIDRFSQKLGQEVHDRLRGMGLGV